MRMMLQKKSTKGERVDGFDIVGDCDRCNETGKVSC